MKSEISDTFVSAPIHAPAPATTDSVDTDDQLITTEEQLRKIVSIRMGKVIRFFHGTLAKLPTPTRVAKPKLKLNMDLSKVVTEDELCGMAGAVLDLCKTPEARHQAAAQLMQISAILLAPDSRKRAASPGVDSGVEAAPSEPAQKRASLSPPPPPPADV